MTANNAYSEYRKLYEDTENTEKLIKIFWSISGFSQEQLFEKLKAVSGADFEDDYSELLKKNNLVKSGLAILGCKSPPPMESIEKILEENISQSERFTCVAEFFSNPAKGYLADIEKKFGVDYPVTLFPYMIASVAILIVRSKNFLNQWSKEFARIVDKHPEPAQSIKNILSLVFRGESLIMENYSSTHRRFNSCTKQFVDLVNDENADAKNGIWQKKYMRILDALGGK